MSATVDGRRDHRHHDPAKHVKALRFGLCWVCGQATGQWKAFAMTAAAVSAGVSAVAAQHRDCAVYTVQSCPHMTTPGHVRASGGVSTGVALVVTTRRARTVHTGQGPCILLGVPHSTSWFAGGHQVQPDEVKPYLVAHRERLRQAIAAAGDPAGTGTLVSQELGAVDVLLTRVNRA